MANEAKCTCIGDDGGGGVGRGELSLLGVGGVEGRRALKGQKNKFFQG